MSTMAVFVPEPFRRTIVEVYGERGERWLKRLPELVSVIAERWGLTLLPPFPLSYNYVAPVLTASGGEAVLKLAVADGNPEFAREAEALRRYDGRGIARLLEWDEAEGALLLERLRPGMPLANMVPDDDDRATINLAGTMRELWREVPGEHGFVYLRDWLAGLDRIRPRFAGGSGSLPESLLSLAIGLREELLASLGPTVLLHGDLHHENVLSAGRAPWLAIDPKGIVGEAEYDTTTLLYNPLSVVSALEDVGPLLDRRLAILSETLGFDRKRLWAWAVVQSVLSACWSLEDHGSAEGAALTCALALAGRRQWK